MKKLFLVSILLFFFIAPFLVLLPTYNYYSHYKDVAKKYDCYPIETCQSDFDGDGNSDRFLIVDESNENERYNYKLKIFTGANNEILNIKYETTDNTLRTHIAVFEEKGQKKLIIYDTLNAEQFYHWNGEKLVAAKDISNEEREIRKAMSLQDDTGGFRTRSLFELLLIPIFAIYYLLLFSTIGIIYYYKKSKPKLL